MSQQHVTIRSRDGLHLAGTLVTPDSPAGQAVVLVHGGGVTREEGGFFTRLAAGLANGGVAPSCPPGRQLDMWITRLEAP
jgi:dipeptidyl aminopeptidase/acylaminoacyl peptidase